MSFGVYVHYPYCVNHCPYCDFNVAVVRDVPQQAYRDSILAELEARVREIGPRPSAVSLYLGGGTPSLWPTDHIAAIVDGVRARCGLTEDAEITVECNPERADRVLFEGLIEAGVNRLSIGAQSFDDPLLEFLGRQHRAADIRCSVENAQAAGFERLSLDLIHGAHEQSLSTALLDVDEACALGVEHISTYQLTIESATPFGARASRGETGRGMR